MLSNDKKWDATGAAEENLGIEEKKHTDSSDNADNVYGADCTDGVRGTNDSSCLMPLLAVFTVAVLAFFGGVLYEKHISSISLAQGEAMALDAEDPHEQWPKQSAYTEDAADDIDARYYYNFADDKDTEEEVDSIDARDDSADESHAMTVDIMSHLKSDEFVRFQESFISATASLRNQGHEEVGEWQSGTSYQINIPLWKYENRSAGESDPLGAHWPDVDLTVAYPEEIEAGQEAEIYIWAKNRSTGEVKLFNCTVVAQDGLRLVHGNARPTVAYDGFDRDVDNGAARIYFYTSATSEHYEKRPSMDFDGSYGSCDMEVVFFRQTDSAEALAELFCYSVEKAENILLPSEARTKVKEWASGKSEDEPDESSELDSGEARSDEADFDEINF